MKVLPLHVLFITSSFISCLVLLCCDALLVAPLACGGGGQFSQIKIQYRRQQQHHHRYYMSKTPPSDDNRNSDKYFPSDDDEDEIGYREFRKKQEDLDRKMEVKVRLQNERDELGDQFDLEKEMKKVKFIAPGLAVKEQEMEENIARREGEMYDAKAKFDLKEAGRIQDEISQGHIDDCGSVLQANSAFYRAFKEKDILAMEKVWCQDATSQCIHPSQKALLGGHAILESWKAMFEATSMGTKSWMEPTNIRLVVKGSTAVLSCDEEVFCRRFAQGQKRGTEKMNKLTATNIFRKIDTQWFMSYHHASWHADSNAAKKALASLSIKDRKTARKYSDDLENNPAKNAIMGTDDIEPYISSGEKGKSSMGEGSSLKKIIMGGSLSDLLSGGLSGGSPDIFKGNLGGGGANGDDNPIIRINAANIFDGITDDIDSDADNEDDAIDEVTSFMKDIDKLRSDNNVINTKLILPSDAKGKSDAKDKSDAKGKANNTHSLRQGCISALRKLSDRGEISQKQKRVLLTDIITCSARGEYSMVEVAYELLCGCEAADDSNKDVAEEEFADQCRVFSQSLSSS